MEHIVKILEIVEITHDVKRFQFERPEGYNFIPGQATDVSVNKPNWENELRPFTFTSLNDRPYLEFTIKRYANHDGVTNQLHQLSAGDEIIIRDTWGAIRYQGVGYFIAGGAGITPFIAILRQLHKDNALHGNKLFFSNKTSHDIIYDQELTVMLGNNAVNILSQEENPNYLNGRIDEDFLKQHITDYHARFYVCGPDKMISDIAAILLKNGAKPDLVIFEK